MSMLFDLLVVAAILWFAYQGWLVGLRAAGVAALELLACLSVAVVLHEAAAGYLQAGFTMVFGDWDCQAWAILLAFALLAWGSFAVLRLQFHRETQDDDSEDDAEIDPLTDRLAGAVAGGVGGAVFVGGALVTLSMIPFLAGLKPSGDRMSLDVGKLVLRAAGQFTGERHAGRSLPLLGEPPSRMSVAAARLTSEPWVDVDDDGICGEADRFRDVDGNGTFTKDLYFEDIDGDGVRRIGLIDKYVVGRWDGALKSNDRPRPDLKKPVAQPAPAPAKPGPAGSATASPPRTAAPADTRRPEQKPATGAKPAEPKPGDAKPADAKPAEPKPGDAKPGDAKPADAKPADAKPADAKPADAKPADAKPADAKPGDAKPGDAKPAEPKPGDAKPADAKPGDAKPAEPKPGDAKKPPPSEKKPGDDF